MPPPATPPKRPDSCEPDKQPDTEAVRTPAPRTSEHDEVLRPNPPFPGDAPA